MPDSALTESKFFHYVTIAMGMLLLGIASWIAVSVAHIPSIDQKLDDFIMTANQTFTDHEARLRLLEGRR